MSFETGQTLTVGRYEAITKIASGGMGNVYLARATGVGGFERLVAMKVIHDHLADDDERFSEMLLEEARLAARVRHHNVVAILDVGLHEGAPYLVMEYIDGCTVAELLKHSRNRPLEVFINIMLGALEGLHAAHVLVDEREQPLNIVHRDVSPQNILVGLDGTARLTDFGIAKAESAGHYTLPGSVRGKPSYMAPEQARSKKVDARSDIFSAGIVLWSMITGRKLFKADSVQATIDKVVNGEIPPPSRTVPCPPGLDAICLRALQRDPMERFASAREMSDALRSFAIDNGLLASPAEVGAYVEATVGPKLAARRAAIRAAATARQAPASISSIWSSSVEESQSSSVPVASIPPSQTVAPVETLEMTGVTSESVTHTPALSAELVVTPDTPGPSTRWLVIALLTSAFIALAAILWTSFESTPVVSPPVSPAAPVAPPEVVEPEVVEPEVVEPEVVEPPPEPTIEPTSEPERTRTRKRRRRRPATPKPVDQKKKHEDDDLEAVEPNPYLH